MCLSNLFPFLKQDEAPQTPTNKIDIKETNLFAAYEKAIEGYQFQVSRYNTWMSYAAISVGVLFVAVYSLWPTESLATTPQDTRWLLFIISIVGWLICLGWYGALLGYHTWNTHWIGIIKQIEKKIIKATHSTSTIVDIYLSVYANESHILRFSKNPHFAPRYISTQKIMASIIISFALGWIAIITLLVRYTPIHNAISPCWVCICLCSLSAIVLLLFHHVALSLYSSKLY